MCFQQLVMTAVDGPSSPKVQNGDIASFPNRDLKGHNATPSWVKFMIGGWECLLGIITRRTMDGRRSSLVGSARVAIGLSALNFILCTHDDTSTVTSSVSAKNWPLSMLRVELANTHFNTWYEVLNGHFHVLSVSAVAFDSRPARQEHPRMLLVLVKCRSKLLRQEGF